MRIIDADALKEEIEFHPTSVSVCMTVAEAKGQTEFKNRCLDDIDNAPTIDAIPVEWIFEQMQILHELHNKNEYVLQWLIEMWQKEQEAR